MSCAARGTRRTCSGSIEMIEFLVEFWSYARDRKKYWLLPIILVLVALGGLIVLTSGSAIAPWIYTLF